MPAVECISPLVTFPIGADDGVEMDVDLWCATATEAAINIQQENAEGLESIYDHAGIAPELRAEATRRIASAFSTNQLLREGRRFLTAVAPASDTVDRLAAHFDKTANHSPRQCAPMTDAQTYIDEARSLHARGRETESLQHLETAIDTSIRAGDIFAALSCLKLIPDLGIRTGDLNMAIRLAEHSARLGDQRGASNYMTRVFEAMNVISPTNEPDALLLAPARSYLRIGALEGAGILIETVNDEEMKFLMLLEKADALMKFRRNDEAKRCLHGECIALARSAKERPLQLKRLQAIVDTFIEHRMKDDATAILKEVTEVLNNRNEGDRDHLAWAAQAMKSLDYPVEDIVYMLTDGWLHEDHPDFQGAPGGWAKRQSQAHMVRERWCGRLDHIADELLTA